MAELTGILVKSFQILYQEPQLFLPKLVSTFLSSVWLIGFVSGYLSMTQLLVSFPFIAGLGVFVSLMVASMVKNQDTEQLLRKGFSDALGRWKSILPTTLFLIFAGFVTAIPLSIGLAYFISQGSNLVLLAGALLSLLLVLGIGFLSYFLPITLLEKDSFRSSFSKSVQSSKRNSGTVIGLTLFSLILLSLAFTSGEYLQTLGYIGFVAGRLVATTVNTYLFVISPSYYLEQN